MEEIKQEFEEFQKVLREYVEMRIELIQLNSYDLFTQLGARMMEAFIMALAGLSFFLFAGIGLAFFIGEYLENYSFGFFIVGGFNLLLLLIGFIFNETLVFKPLRFILLKWIIKKQKR